MQTAGPTDETMLGFWQVLVLISNVKETVTTKNKKCMVAVQVSSSEMSRQQQFTSTYIRGCMIHDRMLQYVRTLIKLII